MKMNMAQSVGLMFRPMRAFLALPLFFLLLGLGLIVAVLIGQHKDRLS